MLTKKSFTESPNFVTVEIGKLLDFYQRPCKLNADEIYQLVTVKRRNEGIIDRGLFKGSDIKTPSQFYIYEGDFLISKRQIVHGACEIVPPQFDQAIVSNEYAIVRGKDGIISTEYFNLLSKTRLMKQNYFLSSYGVDIEKMVFNVEDWKKRSVWIPSLEEQNKVVQFFKMLNKKIQLQQEKINLLKKQKKGFMQKIFSQELRFRDADGQVFPEWEMRELKDFAKKITLKNKNLTVRNVISNSAKNGLIAQSDYFDKEIANQENINGYYIISKGDFVYNPRISSDAPYGPINIYNGNEDGIVSPLYTCFKVENINKEFLYHYFKSSEWYRFIYLNGDSGARHDRVSIKDTTFLELPIRVPSPEEQVIIAKFLSHFQKKISFEELKLKTQMSQKEAFMQQMFI